MTKKFIGLLWNSSEREQFADVIKDQITAMKDCIEVINTRFLAKEEIEQMGVKIFKEMQKSEDRKKENESAKKQGDLEEEEVQQIDEENQEEDTLFVSLGDLMGILFKTHKELTLPIVEQLYKNVLQKALQPQQSEEMRKFGIFIICDMIEFLGIELIPQIWPELLQALMIYVTDKSCAVRQAAAYGIGVLSEKSH